jgi:hypothetical protein
VCRLAGLVQELFDKDESENMRKIKDIEGNVCQNARNFLARELIESWVREISSGSLIMDY